MKQRLKNLMLPIAMVGGAIFYKWMDSLIFLSPYLIFMMLFITYCRVSPKDLKPHKIQLWLLMVQILLSAVVYFSLFKIDHLVAEGIFICVFIPTATAAPVITSMLGGSISKVVTYSFICNVLVAIFGPAILAAIGDHPEITFWVSLWMICKKVFPLLIVPIVLAFILRKVSPNLHDKIANHQSISFYLWAVSLFIVVGSSISFVIKTFTADNAVQIVCLALGALLVCLLQFWLGRRVGSLYGDKVTGGQSLGQKNTVLAIWLSLVYLNPISSIAPAAYVAWQNIVNSWQLMKHKENSEDMSLDN